MQQVKGGGFPVDNTSYPQKIIYLFVNEYKDELLILS